METVFGMVDEQPPQTSEDPMSAANITAATNALAMAVDQDVNAAFAANTAASQQTIQAMYHLVNQRSLMQRITRPHQATAQATQPAAVPQIAYFTAPTIPGPSTAAFVPVDMMGVFPPLIYPPASVTQSNQCVVNQPVCEGCIYNTNGGSSAGVNPHHNHPMASVLHTTPSTTQVLMNTGGSANVTQNPAPRDRQVVGGAVPQTDTVQSAPEPAASSTVLDRTTCWEQTRANVAVAAMASRRLESLQRRHREPTSLVASYHMMMDTVERAKQRKRKREEEQEAAVNGTTSATQSTAATQEASTTTTTTEVAGTSTSLHPSVSTPTLALDGGPTQPKLRRTASARDVRVNLGQDENSSPSETVSEPPVQPPTGPMTRLRRRTDEQLLMRYMNVSSPRPSSTQVVGGTVSQQPSAHANAATTTTTNCLTCNPCNCGAPFCTGTNHLANYFLYRQQQQQHQQAMLAATASANAAMQASIPQAQQQQQQAAAQLPQQPQPQPHNPFFLNQPVGSVTLPTHPATNATPDALSTLQQQTNLLNTIRAYQQTQQSGQQQGAAVAPVAAQLPLLARYPPPRLIEQVVDRVRTARDPQVWPASSYFGRFINPEALYVPITTAAAAAAGYNPGRFLGLDMMVGWIQSDFLNLDRPPLERHHMFGAPISDPQPVGVTVQDIEKCTEKVQFVKDAEKPEEETERCTVCLTDFETGEEIRTLRCTHIFHPQCIDKWLVYNKKCPVCRLDVDKQLIVDLENNASSATASAAV